MLLEISIINTFSLLITNSHHEQEKAVHHDCLLLLTIVSLITSEILLQPRRRQSDHFVPRDMQGDKLCFFERGYADVDDTKMASTWNIDD
jgi:hypothetical protein